LTTLNDVYNWDANSNDDERVVPSSYERARSGPLASVSSSSKAYLIGSN